MEWLQDFHFLRPWWLLGLIIPFLWGWFMCRNERVQSSWAEVCDEHLLNYLLIKGDNRQRRLSYVIAVLFMISAIIALAGPTWIKKAAPTLSADNPVMILLNMSSDMKNKDVAPDRLTRARYIIKDFIQTLRSTEIGLEVYSDEPFIISPLTEDTTLIDNLLPAITYDIMPANGDRLDRAIDMAAERMKNTGYNTGNIIVLTSDVGEYFDAALESAAAAHDKGFDVNIIKVSAQPNEKLQMVAQKGHGIYLNYNHNYQQLSNKINNLYAKQLNESKNIQSIWVDMGYYLFWLPALLLLYYYRRGVILVLLFCLVATQTHAGWFLNNNQEAMQYFKDRQYDKAAHTFEDTKWRGAAAYKNGDYLQAYREFAKSDDVVSLYNQGNALAKSGKIDEAIAKYEKVLKRDPQFKDAEFNLEYLKKMQQNQNQKQNQKQDNKQDNQQQQKSGENEKSQDNQQQSDNQGNEQQKQEQSREQTNKQSQNAQEQQNDADKTEKGQNGQQNGGNERQNQDKQQSDDAASQAEPSADANGSEPQSEQTQAGKDAADRQSKLQEGANFNEKSDDSKQNGNDKNSENENIGDRQTKSESSVQSGNPDERGHEAEEVQIQNGDKDVNDSEKIRARVQKFRDIPEDNGGLLRALIAKEYSKNRYRDE